MTNDLMSSHYKPTAWRSAAGWSVHLQLTAFVIGVIRKHSFYPSKAPAKPGE